MTQPLEPSDSPEAALEADLHSLGDDEYFDALEAMPPLRDADSGDVVDHREGVRDERQRR